MLSFSTLVGNPFPENVADDIDFLLDERLTAYVKHHATRCRSNSSCYRSAPVEIKQSFALAREAVQQWATSKGLDIPHINDLVEARRSMIHGIITLAMARRIAGGPERAKHILLETMKDLLFAWSNRLPG